MHITPQSEIGEREIMNADIEPKEIFLSRAQIQAKYLNGEISLSTLISCLTPGLRCFENSGKVKNNVVY